MKGVSLQGYNSKYVTMLVKGELKAGDLVAMGGNNTVEKAVNKRFVGVAHAIRDGYALVQTGGFAVLGCWEELCRRLRPAVQPQEHRERLSLACAALAYYRLQRMQGEVYSGIKVGDISLTAGSGQQSEAMVLEMVGDLLDSVGVCVQGVDVCSRNR